MSFVSLNGFSQVFPLMPKYYKPLDSSIIGNENKEEEKKNETLMKLHNKVSYSVAVGTGYSSFGSDMSMMNTYVAPTVDYQVNSKLNFSVTGIVMQNNYSGLEGVYGNDPGYMYNSNVSNYGIAGSAYYQLNDKWSVWGDGAYFENQSVFNDYRADVYNTDYKTISVGVGYKVNDNVNFNLQIRHTNGIHPSYQHNSLFGRNRIHNAYDDTFGFWYY